MGLVRQQCHLGRRHPEQRHHRPRDARGHPRRTLEDPQRPSVASDHRRHCGAHNPDAVHDQRIPAGRPDRPARQHHRGVRPGLRRARPVYRGTSHRRRTRPAPDGRETRRGDRDALQHWSAHSEWSWVAYSTCTTWPGHTLRAMSRPERTPPACPDPPPHHSRAFHPYPTEHHWVRRVGRRTRDDPQGHWHRHPTQSCAVRRVQQAHQPAHVRVPWLLGLTQTARTGQPMTVRSG